MKNVFIEAMKNPYDLTQMLQRINTHHILGNLTDADRTELETMARDGASLDGSADVLAMLRDHEERLRALEQTGTTGGDATAAPDAYVDGKWYRAGDRVTYGGKVWECIAPDGVVCVWSPETYPAYWQEVG